MMNSSMLQITQKIPGPKHRVLHGKLWVANGDQKTKTSENNMVTSWLLKKLLDSREEIAGYQKKNSRASWPLAIEYKYILQGMTSHIQGATLTLARLPRASAMCSQASSSSGLLARSGKLPSLVGKVAFPVRGFPGRLYPRRQNCQSVVTD